MASTMLDNITETATDSLFIRLPGELRNVIYHCYFEAIFESQGLEANATCKRVESLKAALPILRTSRAIRTEVSSIFWTDYVTRCHWGFGARHDDDDRMVSFCEAARRCTLDVDITFQKRHLNTSSMSANIVWLVLQSASDLTEDIEALRRLREEWEVKHQDQQGFVWAKSINIGSHDNAMVMKYTYQSGEHSWVQFRGNLAVVEWKNIFASAEAGVELQV
ncbi:hypothetical protein MBLNU13_g08896t1 [Cladosporium sp. NU13]